jgi:hypothetical protein
MSILTGLAQSVEERGLSDIRKAYRDLIIE